MQPNSAESPGAARAGLRVAMALYGTLTNDSRVIREAETLAKAGHQVTVYCIEGVGPADASFRFVAGIPRGAILPDGSSPFLSGAQASRPRRLLARIQWLVGYSRTIWAWGRWATRDAGDVDVWHVHDLTGLLAIGPLLRRRQKLIYDSHEIFLEIGTAARLPKPMRRLLGFIERRLTRRAEALVTVNDTYAEVLTRRLKPRRTVIIRNTPSRWVPPSSPDTKLRDAIGIGPSELLVLYHGAFLPQRGLDQLLDAMLVPGLEGVHLALLGFGSQRERIGALAEESRFGGRVHLLKAVTPDVLLEWVSGADVDAMPLQKSNLMHYLTTPNKLWESIGAGVPVVVSDFPAMRGIVLDNPEGPLGEVCEPSEPASIAAAICRILGLPKEERAAMRERCLDAAARRWNWETESAGLLDLYAGLDVERAGAAVNAVG